MLAGKAVVFKVKLHEIYNEKEAELNDEFAASLNFPEVQSVEDLKKYINEYLEYQVEARKADAAREKEIAGVHSLLLLEPGVSVKSLS